MKEGFRQSMSWLHTWAGLLLGWLLYFIFLTGTAGYFDTEIDRWMKPELPVAQAVPAQRALAVTEGYLRRHAAQADCWFIVLPTDRNQPYPRVFWLGGGGSLAKLLDAGTGAPLEARATGGGQQLYRMHWRLHYLPSAVADWLVIVATLFMLTAIVTGVIVHKKIFADFFTFRLRKGQRSWLDAHNVLSVTALPFHLMITFSGLVFYAATLMPLVIAAHYGIGRDAPKALYEELSGGTPLGGHSGAAAELVPLDGLLEQAQARWGPGQVQSLDVQHPGEAQARVLVRRVIPGPLRSAESLVFDGASGALIEARPAVHSKPKAVADVLLGLHEGLFADLTLRWLYFLSGLAGTAMIATGLVLWTVKRGNKRAKADAMALRGLNSVERLNVGTVVGLPIAIAAYFWANRLIPAGLEGRAAWEAHAMFAVWLAMLAHSVWRSPGRGWAEQAWLAAAAYGLLPLLNALTTQRHLGVSLARGDWVMAGFDLTMLAMGAGFACMAMYMTRRARGERHAAARYLEAPRRARL